MNSLVVPGLQFYAEPMSSAQPFCPTMYPQKNELYVVCMDLSVQAVHDPRKFIGWQLMDDGVALYYRLVHTDLEPERCLVRFHGITRDIPMGLMYNEASQNADVIFQMDNEPEVSSY
jgi:hypothetical protein